MNRTAYARFGRAFCAISAVSTVSAQAVMNLPSLVTKPVLVAANTPMTVGDTITVAPPASSVTTSVGTPNIIATGNIDFRPSWTTKKGSFASENVAELGAKIGANTVLTYVQEFYSNIYNPKTDSNHYDLHARVGASYMRLRFNNLVKTDSGFALSYEARPYFPTLAADRQMGFVGTVRNYFKFSQNFLNSKLNVTVMELPIIHAFKQSSFAGAALPVFENRVYIIPTWYITQQLYVSLPIMFHQQKNQNAEGAKGSGAWNFFAWTWPEIDYSVTKNITVGAAFYSDNLIAADLGATAMSSGLERGVFQLVANVQM